MDICELLKSRKRCPYYSNIEDKGREYFETRTRFILKPHTASEILEVCRLKGFCPYELVKDSLPNVNVVALSYLYIFDPAIRAHFLKSLGLPLRKTILIIDEAHNLPETAIEVASTALTLFSLIDRSSIDERRISTILHSSSRRLLVKVARNM